MTLLGLIPARAGSRRLPGKNLLPLDGKPLLAHTCDAALAAGVFSALYVNTDSPEIADAARSCRVPCPTLRPPALADDSARTRDANNFLLRFLLARGECFDALMVLQPTSPLRTAEDIRFAWDLFRENAPCAVESVSPVGPAHSLGRLARDGGFESLGNGETLHRLNGAIFLYSLDDYLHEHTPARTLAYVMPACRGVDIDTFEDLQYAECLLRSQSTATI